LSKNKKRRLQKSTAFNLKIKHNYKYYIQMKKVETKTGKSVEVIDTINKDNDFTNNLNNDTMETEYEKTNRLKNDFCNLIDEIYGSITICGGVFTASKILKEIDPIAFRCYFSDYESEIEYETELQTA